MPSNEPAPHRLRFGPFELDVRSGELWRGAERVLLPDQPFRLLLILSRERGNLVTRDALRQQLWSDDTFVDFEAGLNAAVKRLREILGDSAASPTYIETLPRRGYRFIARVEAAHGSSTPEPMPAAGTVEPPAPRPAPITRDPVAPMPTVRTSALVVVAIIAIVVAIVGWASRPPREGASAPPFEGAMTRLTNLGTVMRASLSPDGRDLAYVVGDGIHASLWVRREGADPTQLVGPLNGAFESLTFGPNGVIYYTFFSPDKTNIALYRVSIGGPPEVVLDASGGIAFSPDGSKYACVSNLSLAVRESRVVLVDSTHQSRRLLTTRRTPESFVMLKPAWSPDGTQLAVFAASDVMPQRHEIVSVSVSDGATRRIADVPLAQVEGAAWLPGARELIVSGREGRASPQRLWSVSIASGAIRPLTDDVSDYTMVGVPADGSRVLAVRFGGTRSLWVADAAAPDRATRVAEDAGSVHGFDEVAWARDGQLLYTLAEAGNADIWSLDPVTGHRQRLTTDVADDYHPAVSPDGRTIVFGSNRSGRPGLWSMSRDGGNVTRLTTGGDTRPSFSPDGTWVAFQRSGVETTPWMIFRVSLESRKVEQVTSPPTMRPSVSPDGRFVAHYWMTPDRWALAVTPAAGGVATTIIAVEPTHYKRVVRWAPDGRSLAFIDGAGGASNLWLQPLDHGPRQALTHFADGTIETFDWSRDGSKLAWMRVHEVRDIVAIALKKEER